MSEQRDTSRLAAAVFRAWQEAGIDFLVLRNYDKLPDHTTNDIDVLVKRTQLRQAEQALLTAMRDAGFRLHNRAEFAATLALYLSSRLADAEAHFDLCTALNWHGFEFLECADFLERKSGKGLFSIPHPAHEAASNLLESLLYHGKVKEKYKPSIAGGFRAHPAIAADLLARSYGSGLGQFLATAAAQENWTDIEARVGALRRTLILRQLTVHPWKTAKSLLADATRLAWRFIRPPGLILVLCGPDGCGKSTTARALMEGLAGTFSPRLGRHFHWKPALFAAEKRAARGPATDPHGQPVRSAAASLFYFAAHAMEFILGSRLCFRPVTFYGGLVLIDRYYYDFFVDQRRYRLRVPRFLVRLGYVFLKKPDLVVLLDAPTEVLQGRKQEVALAETQRQRQAYRELAGGLPQGRIIDATQPPEKVAADIHQAVLNYLAARTRKRGFRQAAE